MHADFAYSDASGFRLTLPEGEKGTKGEKGVKGFKGVVNPNTELIIHNHYGLEFRFGSFGVYLESSAGDFYETTSGTFTVGSDSYTLQATNVTLSSDRYYANSFHETSWVNSSGSTITMYPASLAMDASGNGPYQFEHGSYTNLGITYDVRASKIAAPSTKYFPSSPPHTWTDSSGNEVHLMHADFAYSDASGFHLRLPQGEKGAKGEHGFKGMKGDGGFADSVDTVQRQLDMSGNYVDASGVSFGVNGTHENVLRVVSDGSGNSDLEIVHGTRDSSGNLLDVDTILKVFSDGSIRIKSGVFISQNPSIPGTNEFALNVVTRPDGLTELEVCDVNGDPQFNVLEYAP
jgi:hypothetical protein